MRFTIFLLINWVFQLFCMYNIGWMKAKLRYSKVVVKPMFKEWESQLNSGKEIDFRVLFEMLFQGHVSPEMDPWIIRTAEKAFTKKKKE